MSLTEEPLVMLRPDMGATAGLGHFARCAALADALDRAGAKPQFLVEAESRRYVEDRGFEAIAAVEGEPDDPLGAKTVVASTNALVVDSYRVDGPILQRLYDRFSPLVVIDDLAGAYAPADLLVNGAAHARELPYELGRVGEALLGTDFLLLRPATGDAEPRQPRPDVASVLVTTGGGDPLRMMHRLLEVVRSAVGSGPVIRAVIGPLFDPQWDSPAVAEQWGGRGVVLHRNVADMRPLIDEADLAVSTAGLVLYELALGGVPTVAFSIADNQVPQLGVLARQETLRSAGDARAVGFWRRLAQEVESLSASYPERLRVASRSRETVDGRGADRVAKRILTLMAREAA